MNNIDYGQLVETGVQIATHDIFIVNLFYGGKDEVFIFQIRLDEGWFDIGSGHKHWNLHASNHQLSLVSIYDLRFCP